jgi:16S rRNA (guanine527-N7)-methyltransferase
LVPDVTPVQIDRFLAFATLLREKALPRGWIAASDGERILDRHIADSVRAVAAVQTSDGRALDVGSGAGLPGIPLAVALPRLRVTLVEPRRSRAAFLELAAERLELANVSVEPRRVEDLTEPVDVAFARAFAPARETWSRVSGLLLDGGRLCVYAGRGAEVPPTLPGAAFVRVLETAVLATSGPLIIIGR